MKKVIFTEEQMRYILGESEVFNYLDKSDQGCDASIESNPTTGGEVYTNDLDADEFPTTDKIAASKIRTNPFYRNSGFGTMYEDKGNKKKVVKNDKGEVVPEFCPKCGSKVGLYIKGEPVYLCSNKKCKEYFGTMPFPENLSERNHQLDGKTFRLGKKINAEIDNLAANNSGDKMLNNMAREKDASANCLYVRQNRLKKMKQDNPERYQRINGKRLEKTIGDAINRAISSTKTEKSQIQDPLLMKPQVFGQNNSGKSKKNTNTIYYEAD